jgi:parvulin-like peptidyl-prolyl isomerase
MPGLLREPLVQFGVLAVLLFVFFRIGSDDVTDPLPRNKIVVTEPDVSRLITQFEAVWKRTPTQAELDGLVTSHLAEEVLVREALQFGLDRGDAVIRNRLRQKMLFIAESAAQTLEPDDLVLAQHLRADPGKFARPARVSFQQVFLGEAPDEDAIAQARAVLTKGQPPETVGTRSLLPGHMAEVTPSQVDRVFGAGFFAGIETGSEGQWLGPVRSGYGLHLVRVDATTAGSLPDLVDVRAAVLLDWRRVQFETLAAAQLAELTARYDISRPDAAALQKLLPQ